MSLLTISQVAEHLNVSKSLAYLLVERGKLISHRIGTGRGTIRVSEEDLKQYVNDCRVDGTIEFSSNAKFDLRSLVKSKGTTI